MFKEEFQEKLSDGKFTPHIFTEELRENIDSKKSFDAFTGEGFRRPFKSLSDIDFETSFDSFPDEGFLPRIGLHNNQLNDVDIDIINKGRNFDLIEFGDSKLPRLSYGMASRMELPNNLEFGDFSFGDRPPFLNDFLGDEIANLTETAYSNPQ